MKNCRTVTLILRNHRSKEQLNARLKGVRFEFPALPLPPRNKQTPGSPDLLPPDGRSIYHNLASLSHPRYRPPLHPFPFFSILLPFSCCLISLDLFGLSFLPLSLLISAPRLPCPIYPLALPRTTFKPLLFSDFSNLRLEIDFIKRERTSSSLKLGVCIEFPAARNVGGELSPPEAAMAEFGGLVAPVPAIAASRRKAVDTLETDALGI